MRARVSSKSYFSIPDMMIFMFLSTIIYGVVGIANQWRADFHPLTEIELSVRALPYYTLMSAARAVVAYFISLFFSLGVGFLAARTRAGEKIIIPLLDIFQSIPVLGFLPGLLLGLVSLFPSTNTGLEMAAVIMIFTGQVWNMTFSFYASLKSIPSDFREASTVIGLNRWQKLFKIELPFSAVNLAWNSLLSMAGGWFFLIPCEAITLGEKEYRLPGIGAYMDVAIKKGNHHAMVWAVVAMVLLILLMDFAIWRPILSWVQKFRLEEIAGAESVEPLMKVWIRKSKIVRWIHVMYRTVVFRYRARKGIFFKSYPVVDQFKVRILTQSKMTVLKKLPTQIFLKIIVQVGLWVLLCVIAYGAFQLIKILATLSVATWIVLIRDTFLTLLRVVLVLFICTIWTVPVGIWIGTSAKRIRFTQPIIQVIASFPAPMLYPLVVSAFFSFGFNFPWTSTFLMLMGVQWYLLINVIAGALRIPRELNYAMNLMETSQWDRWRLLYLPSVFPALVTGWVTAAGGAWNASVVAEYLFYQGTILKANGLGATLSVAIAHENFALFAASLTLMVLVVVLLNRFVWSPIYQLAQVRYRMDA